MSRDVRAATIRRNSHLRLPDHGRTIVDHPTTRSLPSVRALPEELRAHPLFSQALARYVRERFARARTGTRKNIFKAFRLLWTFLEHEHEDTGRAYLSWVDVDDGLLSRLIGWMSNAEVGPSLSPVTKAQRYNVIRAFFEWLKLDLRLLPEGPRSRPTRIKPLHSRRSPQLFLRACRAAQS